MRYANCIGFIYWYLLFVSCNTVSEDKGIFHIVHMGQSLGAGEQSLPIVTTTPSMFGNISFKMGTHTWSNELYPDQPELRSSELFSFIPLRAWRRGAEGETVANGMCDHLSATMLTEEFDDKKFLFSYAGQGGRYLRELDKRHDDAKDPRAGKRQSYGGYYKTSIDDVKRAKHEAKRVGSLYNVFAITWMQGEANNTRKMSRWGPILSREKAIEGYIEDLVALKNDYQKDIKRITNQSNKVPFFTYQTAGLVSGKAQLLTCLENEDMFLVAPTYFLPNAENSFYMNHNGELVHGDGIHLTADGERWLGELFGKVMRKVIIEGESWNPLLPLNAFYKNEDSTIIINFNVPAPPLIVDTSFLPKQGSSFGFCVYDEKGINYKIEDVRVESDTSVALILEKKLEKSQEVYIKYGWNSYVFDISNPIKFIDFDTIGQDGHPSIEIKFDGDIVKKFKTLSSEGVFYLHNNVSNSNEKSDLIVREVFLDPEGNTVLRGEWSDYNSRNQFEIGQFCHVSRRYSYGNIRDSDTEQSIYTFEDINYGKRNSQFYPLWNWLVTFIDLNVENI